MAESAIYSSIACAILGCFGFVAHVPCRLWNYAALNAPREDCMPSGIVVARVFNFPTSLCLQGKMEASPAALHLALVVSLNFGLFRLAHQLYIRHMSPDEPVCAAAAHPAPLHMLYPSA